jgi:DNA-binding transcriptional LysR family regulator
VDPEPDGQNRLFFENTEAAISRQIRELELFLGTELFTRTGREVRLTASGTALFDAAQLSLLNNFQATERIYREPLTDPGALGYRSPNDYAKGLKRTP